MSADLAREKYQKIYACFAQEPAKLDLSDTQILRRQGREIEVVVNGNCRAVQARLEALSPETLRTEALTLEEIFVRALKPQPIPAL